MLLTICNSCNKNTKYIRKTYIAQVMLIYTSVYIQRQRRFHCVYLKGETVSTPLDKDGTHKLVKAQINQHFFNNFILEK